MTEERRLISAGMPPEDAISICNDLRRDGTLSEYVRQQERNYHVCHCGGVGICADCPNKNR